MNVLNPLFNYEWILFNIVQKNHSFRLFQNTVAHSEHLQFMNTIEYISHYLANPISMNKMRIMQVPGSPLSR